MAWYVMRTAASMPPRSRDQDSRRWFGPFRDREAAERLLKELVEDGHGVEGLMIEEQRRERQCGEC